MKANKYKLEIAMANRCLNTGDLVNLTKMPRPTVNNVITGRSVRPATIGKIARALEIPVEDLIEKEV
ncbi:helix-turn-helix domain-containing protein [Acetobacterium carbinolicum]|uniref:helix-turn-helix domain-containing protein n=1 Tax=Acetobacterium carbinolicum TaxID=52690 RepID=UPI0039BF7959